MLNARSMAVLGGHCRIALEATSSTRRACALCGKTPLKGLLSHDVNCCPCLVTRPRDDENFFVDLTANCMSSMYPLWRQAFQACVRFGVMHNTETLAVHFRW